jgi:hypothetical protein
MQTDKKQNRPNTEMKKLKVDMFRKIIFDGCITGVGVFLSILFMFRPAEANVLNLTPSGVDDTAQLQAALETCSGATSECKIVLSSGIFQTDVLLVQNFRGRITGQGAGQTVIRPVTDRPLRSADHVFMNEPTLDEPYPVLLHFHDGGEIRLSDFTLEFPPSMEVEPYDTGSPNVIEDALLSAIMADGGKTTARLSVSGLEIIAAPRDELVPFGSNLLNAIRFEGQLLFSAPTRLANGEFKADDTRIQGAGLGFALRDVDSVKATIVDNEVVNARLVAIFLTDMGDSQIKVTGNRVSCELVGVQIARGFGLTTVSENPSRFHIAENDIVIDEFGTSLFGPGDGIAFLDVTGLGGIDSVKITDNSILLGAEPFDGVFILGDQQNVHVKKNKISGSALDAGISIWESTGTRTSHNQFDDLQAGLADVWLTDTTSDCIIKEPDATILDEGSNNDVPNLTVHNQSGFEKRKRSRVVANN